jgi:hypothetical protein
MSGGVALVIVVGIMLALASVLINEKKSRKN